MIDLPINAEVQCTDGRAGRSTYIVVNPINHLITHLVVKSHWPPFHEYLVSLNQVKSTAPDRIQLRCSRNDFGKMAPFVITEYIRTKIPDYDQWRDACMAWPYVVPLSEPVPEEVDTYIPVEEENIPTGEVAVRRGARVEATDGYVGQIDELLVNSKTMHVTHLVLGERHLLKHKDITIPVSLIDHVLENVVYLKLDRHDIEELPTVPILRWSL